MEQKGQGVTKAASKQFPELRGFRDPILHLWTLGINLFDYRLAKVLLYLFDDSEKVNVSCAVSEARRQKPFKLGNWLPPPPQDWNDNLKMMPTREQLLVMLPKILTPHSMTALQSAEVAKLEKLPKFKNKLTRFMFKEKVAKKKKKGDKSAEKVDDKKSKTPEKVDSKASKTPEKVDSKAKQSKAKQSKAKPSKENAIKAKQASAPYILDAKWAATAVAQASTGLASASGKRTATNTAAFQSPPCKKFKKVSFKGVSSAAAVGGESVDWLTKGLLDHSMATDDSEQRLQRDVALADKLLRDDLQISSDDEDDNAVKNGESDDEEEDDEEDDDDEEDEDEDEDEEEGPKNKGGENESVVQDSPEFIPFSDSSSSL